MIISDVVLLCKRQLKTVSLKIVLSMMGIAATVAQGAFIDNGNTVTDDVNNLEWFKTNLTTNISFNDMVGNFSNGSMFDGFRHATQTELINLWAQNTPPLMLGANNPSDVTAFTALFGVTQGLDAQNILHAETAGSPLSADSALVEGSQAQLFGPGVISFITDIDGNNVAFPNLGHAIVRPVAPVPEPSTYIFFATLIGAAGIWRYRDRKRKNLHIEDGS